MTRTEKITKEKAIRRAATIASSRPRKDLPVEERVVEIVLDLETLLFPEYRGLGYFGDEESAPARELASVTYEKLYTEVFKAVKFSKIKASPATVTRAARRATNYLFSQLSHIRSTLDKDIDAAYAGDPAAKSKDEIIIYPGFQAITAHRIAHELYKRKVPLIPRMINEYAHQKTGIDIHPGATIGDHFFIDHGTGVVIGETTKIGEWVRIYQGVTLGALSLSDVESKRGKKRHPTIEDHVIIYAGATILGGNTVIGSNSEIGGNVWLTHSVDPNTKVYQDQPNLKFKQNGHNT